MGDGPGKDFWLKRANELMAVAKKFGPGLEEDRREAIGLAARCYRNAGMSGLSVVGDAKSADSDLLRP